MTPVQGTFLPTDHYVRLCPGGRLPADAGTYPTGYLEAAERFRIALELEVGTGVRLQPQVNPPSVLGHAAHAFAVLGGEEVHLGLLTLSAR